MVIFSGFQAVMTSRGTTAVLCDGPVQHLDFFRTQQFAIIPWGRVITVLVAATMS